MDKRNRTGLQSKISHIFAGVPIPKKRKPITEHPDKKKEDEPSALLPLPTDDEFSDEEFSIVQDADSESPVQIDETDVIEGEKISVIEESEASDASAEEESSLEHMLSPQPPESESVPASKKDIVETPEESKAEKTSIESNIPAPPVKEPIIEKPEPAFTREIEIAEIKEPVSVQKMPVRKIPTIESGKKRELRSPRKISPKFAAGRQKSKTAASQPRQKLMAALVIFFSIVLVLVLSKNVNFSTLLGSSGSGVIEQPGPERIITKSNKNVVINWSQPPLYPDNIEDPMGTYIPPATPAASNNNKLVVRGISVSNGQYLATIGIEQKREGDTVNGATILKITENSVEFEKDGKTWTQVVGE